MGERLRSHHRSTVLPVRPKRMGGLADARDPQAPRLPAEPVGVHAGGVPAPTIGPAMSFLLRSTIRRERWPIAAFLLAGIAVGGVVAASTPPVYTATTRSFVGAPAQGLTGPGPGSVDTHAAVSFADLATSPMVLGDVIRSMGLTSTPAQLAARVDVTVRSDAPLLEISVSDGAADRAAATADAIARAVAVQAASTAPSGTSRDRPVRITAVQRAPLPSTAGNRMLLPGLVAGVLGGLLLAGAWVLLRLRRGSAA